MLVNSGFVVSIPVLVDSTVLDLHGLDHTVCLEINTVAHWVALMPLGSLVRSCALITICVSQEMSCGFWVYAHLPEHPSYSKLPLGMNEF